MTADTKDTGDEGKTINCEIHGEVEGLETVEGDEYVCPHCSMNDEMERAQRDENPFEEHVGEPVETIDEVKEWLIPEDRHNITDLMEVATNDYIVKGTQPNQFLFLPSRELGNIDHILAYVEGFEDGCDYASETYEEMLDDIEDEMEGLGEDVDDEKEEMAEES